MFDLDQAIQNWRSQLRDKSLSGGEIDELENHLRDALKDISASTLSEEETFHVAARRLGSPNDLGFEFDKINEARSWSRRTMWTAAALLFAALMTWALYPPTFESVGLLRVRMSSKSFPISTRNHRASGKNYPIFKQQALEAIQAQPLINQALATFDDAEEKVTAERVLSNMGVAYPGNSEILRVSARHRYPDREVASRAIDSLMSRFVENQEGARIQILQTSIIPDSSPLRWKWMKIAAAILIFAAFVIAGLLIHWLAQIFQPLEQPLNPAE